MILYMLIYLFLLYSFWTTSSKIKLVFRFVLIIQFWSIISLIVLIFSMDTTSILGMNLDIKTFSAVFLLNYMITDSFDFYSNLDPSNSKHILDELHNLLKNADLKQYFNNGGGGDPDPELVTYLYHILNTDSDIKSAGSYSVNDNNLTIDPTKLEEIAILIDQHNNNLDKPVGVEFIKEKNNLISYNSFVDYFHHHPYELGGWTVDLEGFFEFYKDRLLEDIRDYDILRLCKIYYETDNKSILPKKMELYYNTWHASQIKETLDVYKTLLDSDLSIRNIRSSNVYLELNDNLLIIGAGILCKDYVYTNMSDFYNADKMISRVVFYTKAWEFYQEALQKYYPFFHHYNWHVKLALLEGNKADILSEIKCMQRLESGVKSMPPLNEKFLSDKVKPTWYNDKRLLYPSGLKENLGYNSIRILFNFDSKTFFLKQNPQIKSFMFKDLPRA